MRSGAIIERVPYVPNGVGKAPEWSPLLTTPRILVMEKTYITPDWAKSARWQARQDEAAALVEAKEAASAKATATR